MGPARAIERLRELVPAADASDEALLRIDPMSWREQVSAVVVRSLGEDHGLARKIEKVSMSPGKTVTKKRSRSIVEWARLRGVREVAGYGRAAIYELGLRADELQPIDSDSFDPDLWAHVAGLVGDDDWGKVASQTVIFVEDRVREWSGSSRGVVGKRLYSAALGDSGRLALGREPGEMEGWRALGVGLVQAVGNVDRHHIQDRADARRYAVGVLGLGSLLLTQLRYQHPDAARSRINPN